MKPPKWACIGPNYRAYRTLEALMNQPEIHSYMEGLNQVLHAAAESNVVYNRPYGVSLMRSSITSSLLSLSLLDALGTATPSSS